MLKSCIDIRGGDLLAPSQTIIDESRCNIFLCTFPCVIFINIYTSTTATLVN